MARARGVTRIVVETAGALLIAQALLAEAPSATPNRLTKEEQKAGWRLLFDGATTAGWRGFKKTDFPADRWVVKDGCLKEIPPTGAEPHRSTDLVTVDTFADFDLRFDWRIAEGGNSGVKYFVTEERSGPVAHEYQLIDDLRHADAKIGPHRQTASFYDVLPPAPGTAARPAGQWNESRILVSGNHVEHWLNGKKVLAYELGSPEIAAAVAKSKFKGVAGFGTKITGRILLQDHAGEVWFRNVKVLAPSPKP